MDKKFRYIDYHDKADVGSGRTLAGEIQIDTDYAGISPGDTVGYGGDMRLVAIEDRQG